MKLVTFITIAAAKALTENATKTNSYTNEYYNDDDYKTIKFQKYGSLIAKCGGEFTDVETVLYPSNELETGDEAYLYIKYTAPFEVTDGYVLTSVNFNGVPYPEFNTSLCSNNQSAFSKFLRSPFKYLYYRTYEKILGEECPIQQGNHAKNVSFTVPNQTGTLKSKISWFSDTGNLLLCIKVMAEILAPNHHHNEI